MHMRKETGGRADLPTVENVLLWSMRASAIGLHRRIPVKERIEAVFARIGAADGAAHMYEFVWILCRYARRLIEIDCVCNPRVSADERRLLHFLALVQLDRSFEALRLLRFLVRADAAVAAVTSAERLTACLTASGRILSLCPLSGTGEEFGPESGAGPDRRPFTLH